MSFAEAGIWDVDSFSALVQLRDQIGHRVRLAEAALGARAVPIPMTSHGAGLRNVGAGADDGIRAGGCGAMLAMLSWFSIRISVSSLPILVPACLAATRSFLPRRLLIGHQIGFLIFRRHGACQIVSSEDVEEYCWRARPTSSRATVIKWVDAGVDVDVVVAGWAWICRLWCADTSC